MLLKALVVNDGIMEACFITGNPGMAALTTTASGVTIELIAISKFYDSYLRWFAIVRSSDIRYLVRFASFSSITFAGFGNLDKSEGSISSLSNGILI